MHEYEKKNAKRGVQQNSESIRSEKTNGVPNSALQDVFAGKRHADSSMMGHSRNLAPSIAAKMSRSFGMDLTGMQVYRSDAMAGSDMKGMAQGNKVVLSSDVDLNTTAGQAILGHEISHIHAQSQGIGLGNSGLYENAALEHQADTEGMLAAQGKSIYSDGAMDMGIGMSYGLGMQGVEGMTTIGGGMGASAGAPMQAGLFKNSPSGGEKEAGTPNPKAEDELDLGTLEKIAYWKKIVGKGDGSASARFKKLGNIDEIVKGARENGEDPVAALEGTEWLTDMEKPVLENKKEYWADLKERYDWGQKNMTEVPEDRSKDVANYNANSFDQWTPTFETYEDAPSYDLIQKRTEEYKKKHNLKI